ncbi:MAG: SAM-dependent methyltransferase [Nanoarchaeota archaeon]|nr:SAM-dependent methyltransferase [Nanoarchaeota archaeon]|tara:strand:- start:545 stop:1249 length:705 start_codon:yes stop_codon:yes gene_type:complete
MTSFDTVGDIVIFSEEINKKKAEEVLKLKNINTVGFKTKFHSGTYRTKKVKILVGERKKETIHKENNVEVKVNVENCYFSPRLSNERLRIAKEVKKDEKVLVIGSGVGIYPIVISKNSKAKEICGIEINPQAHKYAEENVKLNKIKNIKFYEGDVKKVLPKIRKKFDRIIMPLPKNAEKFLDVVAKKLNKKGIIHFYSFEPEEDIKLDNFKILKTVKCGSFGPGKFRICVDIKN